MTPLPELEAVDAAPKAMPAHVLPIGTRLREYEIQGLIGEGTCSIVYRAWDPALQRQVAVKEYMPAAMVGRVRGATSVVVAADRFVDPVRAGLNGFIHEARLLARFDHASLAKVHRFWEENGTAYMAMPCYEGPTLKTALVELGHVPSEAELRAWLKPILNALTVLHDAAVWHQNIGPDEIVLTPTGPVLLGIAAASHAIEAMRHTPAAALKAGFAAIEQYGNEAATTRGPWTDLYALAAVVHAAITGTDPAPAADRLAHDRQRPLAIVAAGLYSPRFLAAIDAAMAVQPKQRPADHAEFRALMGDIDPPPAVSLAPRPDLMQEPFTGIAADNREVTVPDRLPATPAAAGASAAPSPPPAPTEVHAAAAVAKPAAAPRRSVEPAPTPTPPVTPSWMKTARARVLDKRALYGIVAATCATIGIAALVIQFATRPPARGSAAAPAAVAPPTPTRTPAPAPAPTGTPPKTVAPAAAPATTAVATPAPPTPSSAAPAPTAPTAVALPRPPAPAAVPAPIAPPATAAVTSVAERQTRCTEILQKASLEKITPAETDFFKRECK